MDKISVIIPTKDRTQDVIRCLESISFQTILPDEVVIVDSSEMEELKSKLDAFDDLNIKYIHIEVDKKFKGSSNISRNKGIDNSTGDIIILVDDDVILDKEYIRNITYVFDNDFGKKVGGVIGEIIENAEHDKFNEEPCGKPQGINSHITNTAVATLWQATGNSQVKKFYRFAFQTLATIFFLPKYGDGRFRLSGFPTTIKTGLVNDITNVEYLCGCSIAFRREVIKEFRFDENLNIHGCCFGDDDDVAYRVSRKYQNIYTPFAKLIHNSSPVRANKYAKNRLMIMNHHYLFKKNLPQDFKHKFAFWWSVVGLFIREGVMMLTKRNVSGLKGLFSGLFNLKQNKGIR